MTRFDFDVIGESQHLISRAPEKTDDPGQPKILAKVLTATPAGNETPPALAEFQNPAAASAGPTRPT